MVGRFDAKNSYAWARDKAGKRIAVGCRRPDACKRRYVNSAKRKEWKWCTDKKIQMQAWTQGLPIKSDAPLTTSHAAYPTRVGGAAVFKAAAFTFES